jgi:hypothetical protein
VKLGRKTHTGNQEYKQETLSLIASQQLVLLEEKLLTLPTTDQQMDQWSYMWGISFTSKQAYKSLLGQSIKVQQFSWLWQSGCCGTQILFLAACIGSAQR